MSYVFEETSWLVVDMVNGLVNHHGIKIGFCVSGLTWSHGWRQLIDHQTAFVY